MKDYTPSAIRNISLIGHGSSGKTSLSEAMMFVMKAIDRMGSVDEGSTHSDYMKEEVERRSSISTSMLTGEYNKTKFNILDTPGFSDFIGEVRGALNVSDFALAVIHGVSGVEVVTEQVWEFAEEENQARGLVINMLDKENANFDKVLENIENTFQNSVAIHYAVNPGPLFNQVIDLLSMKLMTFGAGGEAKVEAIPAELEDKAQELREKLVEKAAEADDELLEKYFDAGELTQDELVQGLKSGIKNNTVFPVLCSAATQLFGIKELINFLIDFVPSPIDVSDKIGRNAGTGEEVSVKCDQNGELIAQVFKTTTEAHVGEMSFFKVYAGTLRTGEELKNITADSNEKINQLYYSVGKDRNAVDHVVAGDMGIMVKLRNTKTGDVLCSPKVNILLDPPKFPEPSIRASVISKGSGDEDKIAEGLNTLQKADPTFTVTFDPELSQTILSGQGDAQFNVILSRLKDRFGVEAQLIAPKIPYRETIKSTGEAEGKHKKQSGGRGQFGVAWIRVQPNERGAGFEFIDEIVGGVIPRQFIPAVGKGIQETADRGVIAGYQFVDFKATVFDGKYHSVDSDEFSFKMAGSVGFKEAIKKCKTVILEPIFDVEIKCPEDNMGDIMGDISSRRGKVMSMDSAGNWQIIIAKIPLAELYKYANTLRSITSGRGSHRRKFSHYEEVPGDIQQKLIEEYEEKKAEGN